MLASMMSTTDPPENRKNVGFNVVLIIEANNLTIFWWVSGTHH
jgi:hypothetical protein